MTTATICACGQMVAAGQQHECEQLSSRRAAEYRRRSAKQQAHGRNTKQWTRIALAARRRDGACVECGANSDLTGHLDPALHGDHSNARLRDIVTLCRRCHGVRDGRRAHT